MPAPVNTTNGGDWGGEEMVGSFIQNVEGDGSVGVQVVIFGDKVCQMFVFSVEFVTNTDISGVAGSNSRFCSVTIS